MYIHIYLAAVLHSNKHLGIKVCSFPVFLLLIIADLASSIFGPAEQIKYF